MTALFQAALLEHHLLFQPALLEPLVVLHFLQSEVLHGDAVQLLDVRLTFHCFSLVDQEQANISLPHKSATSVMTADLWAQTVTNRHICDGFQRDRHISQIDRNVMTVCDVSVT